MSLQLFERPFSSYCQKALIALYEHAMGSSLTGWDLGAATGISADGTTIVGDGNQGAWIAVILEPSSALLVASGVSWLAASRLRRR